MQFAMSWVEVRKSSSGCVRIGLLLQRVAISTILVGRGAVRAAGGGGCGRGSWGAVLGSWRRHAVGIGSGLLLLGLVADEVHLRLAGLSGRRRGDDDLGLLLGLLD